jgi:TRAP-type C4-dicarboxylate transport system permease large subunit
MDRFSGWPGSTFDKQFRPFDEARTPASVILMTAPIILPPLRAAGFDLIWFGVIMTIIMEMGLIHPPVGLNLFVINSIAPDIGFRDIVMGTLPFVILMGLAVLPLCAVPGIATWLPNVVLK